MLRSSFRTGAPKRVRPASESQAGDGDSQLHAVDDTAELLVKFEDGAGAARWASINCWMRFRAR